MDLAAGFINDVIVTRTAAYFTNSFAPEIYEVPLIDLDVAVSGDGLVLLARTLYANEDGLNRIAVIDLSADLSSGSVVEYLTSVAFDVPTTSARFGAARSADASRSPAAGRAIP